MCFGSHLCSWISCEVTLSGLRFRVAANCLVVSGFSFNPLVDCWPRVLNRSAEDSLLLALDRNEAEGVISLPIMPSLEFEIAACNLIAVLFPFTVYSPCDILVLGCFLLGTFVFGIVLSMLSTSCMSVLFPRFDSRPQSWELVRLSWISKSLTVGFWLVLVKYFPKSSVTGCGKLGYSCGISKSLRVVFVFGNVVAICGLDVSRTEAEGF